MAALEQNSDRPSLGRTWVNASVGSWAVDDPILELGYLTPRFPSGITDSALRREDIAVQRETALVWFSLNLLPYPSSGASVAAWDVSGGWDVGTSTLPPVTADAALRKEFGEILPEVVRASAAEQRPGLWTWAHSLQANEVRLDDRLDSILAGLADLKGRLQHDAPVHGGLGHNHPPDDPEVEEPDRASALLAIQSLETTLPRATKDDKGQLESDTATIGTYATRVGVYALEKIAGGMFATTGGAITLEGLRYLNSVDIWQRAHHLVISITHFIATL